MMLSKIIRVILELHAPHQPAPYRQTPIWPNEDSWPRTPPESHMLQRTWHEGDTSAPLVIELQGSEYIITHGDLRIGEENMGSGGGEV